MKLTDNPSLLLWYIIWFLLIILLSWYIWKRIDIGRCFLGFVAAHTLPVLYERYEDQVDNFAYQVLGQLQHNYRKLDTGVLSRIPKGKVNWKKHD